MSSALDLCTVADVRSWLGLNPTQQAQVATTVGLAIPAGVQVVTPATIANIEKGAVLQVGTGSDIEFVQPTVVTGTTFTASFSVSHNTTPVPVKDVTNVVLGRIISGVSVGLHRKMGRLNSDGSLPTQSTLMNQVAMSERYDGNGNDKLFLRFWPITSVQSLAINGVTIPQSDGNSAGYLIDRRGRSLVLVGLRQNIRPGTFMLRLGTGYTFCRGRMNVAVSYTAGFAALPDDIYDAAIEVSGLNFKRRGWVDQEQNAQPDTIGTVRYQKWEYPPKIDDLIAYYRTVAA